MLTDPELAPSRMTAADFCAWAGQAAPGNWLEHHRDFPAIKQLQADVQGLIGQDAWVVFAVALAGFSHAEVALRFQVSEAAAKKRYQRALLRLRQALQKNV